MEKDPHRVTQLVKRLEDENWKLRSFLKMLNPGRQRQIDRLAEDLGRQAESQMDCRTCGACCRDNVIPVSEEEIARLAVRLGLSAAEVRERWVAHDAADGDHIDARPCPFLSGNLCTVYEARPDCCRNYPYVGGEIAPRMIGIIERAGTCPIIYEMLERLKDAIGFRRYR